MECHVEAGDLSGELANVDKLADFQGSGFLPLNGYPREVLLTRLFSYLIGVVRPEQHY